MPVPKSSFLEKVLGRLGRRDTEGLQNVVERLAKERSFFETVFNAIQDGVLVVEATGRIIYFNSAATRLLGLNPETAEGELVQRFLPEIEWAKLFDFDQVGGESVVRHEFEVAYPRPLFLRLYGPPSDAPKTGTSRLVLLF